MCEICIAVFHPIKHKLANYRDYRILGSDDTCLRDRFRSAILVKNRFGIADKVIGLNFFGEIGLFRELPDGKLITDYKPYLSLISENIEDEIKDDQPFNYSF